jgi:parallel beta-helix repeat protein
VFDAIDVSLFSFDLHTEYSIRHINWVDTVFHGEREMFRRASSILIILFFFVSMIILGFDLRPAKADAQTVYINADGSISPPNAPIVTSDNVTYTFSGNISCPTYHGITVQRSNITIDGNGYVVQGNRSDDISGLCLANINHVIVKNINIESFVYGIWLDSSSNSTLSGNNAMANNFGIYLGSSSDNCVSQNNITNSPCSGIELGYSSNCNNISGNYIANGGNGIVLGNSSNCNCIIENNLTANNQYAIRMSYSFNNSVYHNNFISNLFEVWSDNSVNAWDNGYPSGGNYWSDDFRVDEKCGPGQDVPGTDEISDTPYIIDAYNRDNYPLMSIWSQTTERAICISVPYHNQINSFYCGPATLEMVFDFYGADVNQLEIGDVARTTCYGTYTCDMIRAAHFSNMSTSFSGSTIGYSARKLGYAAFEYAGMTIDELKSLITAGYPIIVATTWHFRVAVGYDSTQVTFQDPLYGMRIGLTYEAFDADWNYSGHWALLVMPWKIHLSPLRSISLGDVVNVTASINYPCSQPFCSEQYPALFANATIALSEGLTLSLGEEAKKIINNDTLTGGASASVTWSVQATALGNQMISVEAEGEVWGFDPPIPPYPELYFYEDRIGGSGEGVLTVQGPVHDIAVTNVTTDRTWVYQGFSTNVNSTVLNNGDFDENATVTLYYNITAGETIGTQNMTVLAGENKTLSFVWNTTGVEHCGTYTLAAVATIPADYTPSDNTLDNVYIKVRILGDLDGDSKVDGADIAIAGMAFASCGPDYLHPSFLPYQNWNRDADMNGDNKVDGQDIALIAMHFGQADP